MRVKKRLIMALSLLSVAITMGIIPACRASSFDADGGSGPKFVAHRGYSFEHCDNTEESFRAAAEMGFYGIETDIRKTKDGYFVCNHDASVVYADGTERKISKTDRDTLLDGSLKNEKTEEDARLCTFETYLQTCKEGNKVAVIELKDYVDQNDARKILKIVDDKYDRKKVTFISFSYLSLLAIKKTAPAIPLQYLSQTENDPQFDSCLQDRISIDVKYTILTEEIVRTFHEAGLTVNVWTVDDESTLRIATELGVDYITTNVFCEE